MSLADSLDILFEDNHCLALNKPAGWPTTHYDGSEETVDRLVKAYLKEKHGKPGNVFLGVVHRLDKPVSGALLFAKTSKAAARLSKQFRENAVEKVYWAVVEDRAGPHPPLPPAGTFVDWLFHDDAAAMVRVVAETYPDAKIARTHYQIKATAGGLSWLELRPQTGRKHQLRVQLASRGRPVYADAKYGSAHTMGASVALHARSLTFLHPVQQAPITVTADVAKVWRGRFAQVMRASDSGLS